MAKTKNAPPKHNPLELIENAKAAGIREVVVSFSGGKDALTCLDLCSKHFERIEAFFMYMVPGLSFQEDTLRTAERKYGIEIFRIPDKRLCDALRGSQFRDVTKQAASLPAITYRRVAHYARAKFGINWIASGESAFESITRHAMIKRCKGVDVPRGYIYPIGFWRRQDVYSYLSQNRIPLPPEYTICGTGASYGGLRMEHLDPISKHCPEDFKKIMRLFPHCVVQLDRWRIEQEAKNERSKREQDSEREHDERNEANEVSEV